MSDWYQHGTRIDSIDVDDRGAQYGDGVFETIAVRDARPRLWSLHMERLQASCDQLGLRLPAESLLERDLERALAQTTVNTSFCLAKILVTAGTGPRGYRRSADLPGNTVVGVFDSAPIDRVYYESGVQTVLCEMTLSEQPKLAGLKTLNRLEQILAVEEWDSEDIFEGLMRDAGERLICGTRSNIFIIRDNVIATPALTRCGVAGIMRKHIMRELHHNNIECEETDITIGEFERADEVFLCNSQLGALPVSRCGDFGWGVGEGTRSVMAMLGYEQVPECRP